MLFYSVDVNRLGEVASVRKTFCEPAIAIHSDIGCKRLSLARSDVLFGENSIDWPRYINDYEIAFICSSKPTNR